MSEGSPVRRLMLPISEYATVSHDGTLQDALRALNESRRELKPGQHPHLSVLVDRGGGVFVGKLGFRALLRALRPQQKSVVLDGMMKRAGVSEDMVSMTLASLEFLSQDLPSLCERAQAIRIRDLMLITPQTIDVEMSLQDLIDLVVNTSDSSFLVVERGDIIGVLRASDLFDEVTRVSLDESDGDCAES